MENSQRDKNTRLRSACALLARSSGRDVAAAIRAHNANLGLAVVHSAAIAILSLAALYHSTTLLVREGVAPIILHEIVLVIIKVIVFGKVFRSEIFLVSIVLQINIEFRRSCNSGSSSDRGCGCHRCNGLHRRSSRFQNNGSHSSRCNNLQLRLHIVEVRINTNALHIEEKAQVKLLSLGVSAIAVANVGTESVLRQ